MSWPFPFKVVLSANVGVTWLNNCPARPMTMTIKQAPIAVGFVQGR